VAGAAAAAALALVLAHAFHVKRAADPEPAPG
jgi:hypothetical protein